MFNLLCHHDASARREKPASCYVEWNVFVYVVGVMVCVGDCLLQCMWTCVVICTIECVCVSIVHAMCVASCLCHGGY